MPDATTIRPLLEQGLAHLQQARPAEALEILSRALALAATDFDALNLAGVAATRLGKLDEAIDLLRRAVTVRPKHAGALNNLGIALRARGDNAAAADAYALALEVEPRYPAARTNLGAALSDLHRYAEAVASFDASLSLRPNHTETLVLKARALRKLDRHSEALATVDLALAAMPTSSEALIMRADVLRSLGQPEAAVETYRRALALAPNNAGLPGTIAFYQLGLCDWTGLGAITETLRQGASAGEPALIPFASLLLFDDPQAQLRLAETKSAQFRATTPALTPRNQRERLHVAYFCADLRNHPTVHLVAEMLQRHDRDRFEITAFAFPAGKVDSYTDEVKSSVDRYIDIAAMSDADAALLARELSVDIGIDMMGHTRGARTAIFANRAAPIQVNYLAYPGTMGAPFIDYIVADGVIAPPGSEADFSEKIVRMPGYYAPRDTRSIVRAGQASRAAEGLPEGAVVYCSFNQASKILPDTFGSWMSVLRQVDRSVLWLLDPGKTGAGNLRRAASDFGVDPSRIVFAPKRPLAEHLDRLRLADLCLDTLPYNAHTTASDALYVGVPILTLPGSTFASRVCASIVTVAGLPELIARDRADFVARAVRLGHSPGDLAALRGRLAERVPASGLFDMERYTRSFERALLEMQKRQANGLPPDHIEIV